MRKRAQGLSLTTIIVAAIALIVLVVLIAIFTGRIGNFGDGVDRVGDPTKTCEDNGGTILESEENQCSKGSLLSSDSILPGVWCCAR